MIVGSPVDDGFFTGLQLTLTCTIELNVAVDSDVNVSSSWLKDGSPLISDDSGRIIVGGAELIPGSPLSYQTMLVFDTLNRALNDSGLYTCVAEVNPSDTTSSVDGNTGMVSRSVDVLGE